jgi:hypothetical protein
MRARRLAVRSLVAVTSTLAVVAFAGCNGCGKKGGVEEVKKDLATKPKLAFLPTPAPGDLVAETYIKDPESFVQKSVDGAGLGMMMGGGSPFQKLIDTVKDENAKKALKAIDPHGGLAAIGTVKWDASPPSPHGVMAAQLKDAAALTAALAAGAKGGEFKTWTSKALDVQVYEPGSEGEIAVLGDTVIVSDSRDALEAGAKYVAYLSTNGPTGNPGGKAHDVYMRLAFSVFGAPAKAFLLDGYGKVKGMIGLGPRTEAELSNVVSLVLGALPQMGDAVTVADLDKAVIHFDGNQSAKALYAAWLALFPKGDATPLLAMPKGESTTLFRHSDGLGPLLYAALEENAIEKSPLSKAEQADLTKAMHALGKSLGHEVVYSQHQVKSASMVPEIELVGRYELADPAAAKGALPTIFSLTEKAFGPSPGGSKVERKPYKSFGAEGSSVTVTAAGAPEMAVTWAIRGSSLYFGGALGPVKMLPIILDPASTGRMDNDPLAKGKISSWPTSGLIVASYADAAAINSALGGLAGLTAAAAAGGEPMWSWFAVDGVGTSTSRGQLPVSVVTSAVSTMMSLFARGSMGGGAGAGAGGF